jgi:hypothetical protein
MHLLAADEEIDGGRQRGEGAASEVHAIIAGLHEVEVGGAQARAGSGGPGVPAGSQSHDGRLSLDENVGIVVWNVEAQNLE